MQGFVLASFFQQGDKFGRLPAQGAKRSRCGSVGQGTQDGDSLRDPAFLLEQERQMQARRMVALIG